MCEYVFISVIKEAKKSISSMKKFQTGEQKQTNEIESSRQFICCEINMNWFRFLYVHEDACVKALILFTRNKNQMKSVFAFALIFLQIFKREDDQKKQF